MLSTTDIERLRDDLLAAGYTIDGLADRLGGTALSGLARTTTAAAARALGDDRDPQASAIRFKSFFLGGIINDVPFNRLDIFAEKLRPLLEPGESALFLGTAMYVAGDEQLGPQRPPLPVDLNPVDIVLGLATPYEREIMTFLTGRSLVGDRGCQAEALSRVLTGTPDLLLTNRRLLVVAHEGQDFRIVWQAPRDTVLAAAAAPRLGQMGRVRLVLSDGSGLAIVLGMVLPGRARRFLAALHPVAGKLR